MPAFPKTLMEWRASIDAATVIRQIVAGLFFDRKVLAAPRRCTGAGSVEAIRGDPVRARVDVGLNVS